MIIIPAFENATRIPVIQRRMSEKYRIKVWIRFESAAEDTENNSKSSRRTLKGPDASFMKSKSYPPLRLY